MNKCGYKTKGCAHGEGCEKSHADCAHAKYFDFLVGRSPEARNGSMTKDDFVACWRDRTKADPKCEGCRKVTADGYCETFARPELRWPPGEVTFDTKCVLANHVQADKKKGTFVNPLKASKKASKGRR